MEDKELVFKPKASLIRQLGDELIKSEDIAVLEMVKNSYDADAKNVQVIMDDIDDEEKGVIIIKDDGIGMDEDIIKNVWLQIGTNYKKEKYDNLERTVLGRLPIGEKGIGRFGAHKLGDIIELTSRKENSNEVHILIDWKSFATDKFLNDIEINLSIRKEAEIFTGEMTGTCIKITKLRNKWNARMLKKMNRAILSLNSPFEHNSDFNVKLISNKDDWIDNNITFKDMKDLAIFRSSMILEGDKIKSFIYYFNPDARLNIPKVLHRRHNISILRKTQKNDDKSKSVNLNKYKIGKVEIKILVFDLSHNIKNLLTNPKFVTEYLNFNGGIKVFRDSVRIYNYGESDNDWLGIDLKRVNVPSTSLSNNLVLGAVYLNRENSQDLIEKTNREGFIDNEAYDEFKDAVDFAINTCFNSFRNIDKPKLRNTNVKELVLDDIQFIKSEVIKLNIDETEKNKINKTLEKIEKDYNYLKDVYLKSSSVGLYYSTIIHEVEKILKELSLAVIKDKASYKIQLISNHLVNLMDNYASLIKKKSKQKVEVTDIIEQAIFNVTYRLEAHKVEVARFYNEQEFNSINCVFNLLVGALLNLFDNSIYWANTIPGHKAKIAIDIVANEENVTIFFADNGPGLTLEFEDVIKPLITTKPGGIGIGLNVVNEIITLQNGLFGEADYSETRFPNEFSSGAIFKITFKKI